MDSMDSTFNQPPYWPQTAALQNICPCPVHKFYQRVMSSV